jgi:hypothetical protein
MNKLLCCSKIKISNSVNDLIDNLQLVENCKNIYIDTPKKIRQKNTFDKNIYDSRDNLQIMEDYKNINQEINTNIINELKKAKLEMDTLIYDDIKQTKYSMESLEWTVSAFRSCINHKEIPNFIHCNNEEITTNIINELKKAKLKLNIIMYNDIKYAYYLFIIQDYLEWLMYSYRK